MERVRHRQANGLHPGSHSRIGQRLNGRQRPRHHRVGGAIQRREAEGAALRTPIDQSLHLGLGGQQRQHAAARRQRLHQPAAGGHQPQCILQAEYTRQMGRHDLPHAVAQQQIRLQAPAQP